MLEVGDLVRVWIDADTAILVEVVHKHSGYYDWQYTGYYEGRDSVVYFSENVVEGTFYGRVV